MRSTDVLEQIEKMGELPILPQTLLQIQKVATDDRSSADDLAEVILRDQALTLRVLRMVNSAFYLRQGREEVRTVSRAVIVLGFETVRKVALGLSVFDMMSKLTRSPHLAEVSSHSTLVAAFAQLLAESSGRMSPEEAFVSALVHDVGKVVLMECSATDYDAVLADQAQGMELIDAERRHYGMGHDRAGRRLAARWGLPVELQNLIGDHHDLDPLHPPSKMEPTLALISYADALARCRPGDEARVLRLLHKAGQALGVANTRMQELQAEIHTIANDLAARLDVALGNLGDYAAVVNVDGSASVAPPLSPEEIARRTAALLDLYRGLGVGMSCGEDSETLIQRVLDGAHDILGFERVVLLRVDGQARELRPWMAAGPGAQELGEALALPLEREQGALALTALQRRPLHVPMAQSEAYGEMAGTELLERSRATGFATAPVSGPEGVAGVLYADRGPEGADVSAEEAAELHGLATQAGLVLASRAPSPA